MKIGPVLVRGCWRPPSAVNDLDDLIAGQFLGVVLDQDGAGQRVGLVGVRTTRLMSSKCSMAWQRSLLR